MKKYGYIFTSEMKKSLVYRGDIWLSALFNIFSVVLAYLLWKGVFGSLQTFNGFTLPEMVTYYLLSSLLMPFTQNDGMLHQFSEEIKSGEYAKYRIKPMSTLGYFISASFGKSLFQTFVTAIVLGGAVILFPAYFAPIHMLNLLTAVPIILLGALLSIIINYMIAMATFKFTDIGFLFLIQNIFKLFLSGSMIPLGMVFGDTLPMFLPFSYTLYYPVILCMGRMEAHKVTAVLVLAMWIVILASAAVVLEKRAAKTFEGVGI